MGVVSNIAQKRGHPGSGRKKTRGQPKGRQVNPEALTEIQSLLGAPTRRDLLIEYLHQIQDKFGYLSSDHLTALAAHMKLALTEVYEVATFYTMYNLSPVGKFFVQVCTTTPCMIRGANKLVEACKEKISENELELSRDKSCSWMEVECLGACVNAPMMQINDDYYEDLDKEKTLEILDKILSGETPKPGSYRGRVNNEPENNRKTLMDLKNA